MDALRLQVVLAAVDRATGPFKKILAGSKGVSAALRQQHETLRKLKSQEQDVSAFRTQSQALQESSQRLAEQRLKVAALAKQLAATNAPTKKLTNEFKEAIRVAGLMASKRKQEVQQLQALRSRLASAGIATAQLGNHERRLRGEIDQANKKIDQQRQRLKALGEVQSRATKLQRAGMSASLYGAGAMYAGQRTVGMGLVPLKAFADQEDAAMQLRAAMMTAGGQVSAEFVKIDALAKKLGNRLPGTTTDFYEMMTMLRRQGMSSQLILGGLGEATAYLGVQLKMGYSEAAEFAAKLQDATRTSERDMMALSDTIQRAFYLGVDADNMLQGFSKMSPALDVLRIKGLQAANAFAPLLVMADQAGMKGEAAGNAYRKIFQGMMDAKRQAKANALISGTGIKLDFTDGKGEFGGMQRMYAQLDKLRALNTVDRLTYLRKQFGDDAETLQALSLLITKGAAGYGEVQKKMAAQASLQQRVNAQLGTLRNLWEATSGTFQNVFASVGEAMAPQMKQLTEWIGGLGVKFQQFAQNNPALVAALGKLVLGGGALLTVLGALLTAGGLAAMAFSHIHRAITLLSGGQSLGALIKNGVQLAGRIFPWLINGARALMVVLGGISAPVWAIIAAVAAVAVVVWKYWGPIKAFMIGVWQAVSAAVAPALAELKTAFAPLAPLWDTLSAALGKVWGWIKQLLTPFQATNAQLAGATRNGQAFGAILGTSIAGGIQLVTKAIGVLMTVFVEWPMKMRQAGVNMVQGLIDGVKSMLGAAGQAISGVGEAVIGRFKSLLGIHSPSRVFAQLGAFTMQGLANGLQNGQRRPLGAISDLSSRMVRGVGAAAALGALAAPAAALDTRAPLSPVQRPAAVAPAGDQIVIHIHAAPGMDPQAIAKEVATQLERLERAKQARVRSKLTDQD